MVHIRKVNCIGTIQERFERKINYTETCWNWTASMNSKGRGMFAINSRPVQAHRVAYQLYKGSIPENLCVLHTCDNGRCVNPDHLWLGTQQENIQDCIKKKRNYLPHRSGKGKYADQ